jgi:putative MATE family efflux protein
VSNNSIDQAQRLGTKRIPALLAHFAVPSVLSLVLHAFYNIVDRIFIGRGVGSLGLAGVTLCFPILLLIFGICMLFSSGASSLISLYLGQKRSDKAEQVLGNTVTAITVIGFFMAITGHFYYRQILSFFSVPAEALPYAESYLKIILAGSPLFLYGFVMTFIIRAEGNPIYATAAIVIGTFVNLILDPIFIFVFKMGTGGAALATIISEAVVALIGIFYMTRRKGIVHVRRTNLKPDPVVLQSIAFLGLSPALMNVAASIQCGFLNSRLVLYGGNLAVAAIGVIFPISSMIHLFTFGMAAGMQPIVGYNYGAGQIGRVKETFFYALKVNFVFIFFFVAMVFIFAERIVSLFSRGDTALTELSMRAIRIFLFFTPLAVVNILGSRFFQAIGKGTQALYIGLLRQIFIFIPALFLLSMTLRLDGIWLTSPVTDILATTITSLFLWRVMKRLGVVSGAPVSS